MENKENKKGSASHENNIPNDGKKIVLNDEVHLLEESAVSEEENDDIILKELRAEISRSKDDAEDDDEEDFSEYKDDYVPKEKNIKDNKRKFDKKILWLILAVLAVFVIISFSGIKVFNGGEAITGKNVLSVDKLHEQNKAGQLAEERGYMYNGYSFVNYDGLWWTELQRLGGVVKVPLHFGPKDVESIPMEGSLSSDFNYGNSVYITIDPTVYNKYYTLSLMELNNNIVQGINRNISSACTQSDPICEERKILNCGNSSNLPVIQLVPEESETRIELTGSCIKVIGNELNLTKAVDRLLYHWYGVME